MEPELDEHGLVRPFLLEGDWLAISGALSKDPVTGEDMIYRIEFTSVPKNPGASA
jgi:hypothetical protein